RDRAALAVDDRVETEVVLERVGADEEIVAAVLGPEDDAAARVLLAGDGPEAHGDVEVGESLVLEQGDRPRLRLDGLGEHLTPAGGPTPPMPGDELPLRMLDAEIVFHRRPLPRG